MGRLAQLRVLAAGPVASGSAGARQLAVALTGLALSSALTTGAFAVTVREEERAAPSRNGEAASAAPVVPVAAVDKPLPEGALLDGKPLAEEDVRAIRALLGRFAAAMTAGDADKVGELLSPALGPEERARIVSRARGEFERTLYRSFALELEDDPPVDRLAYDRLLPTPRAPPTAERPEATEVTESTEDERHGKQRGGAESLPFASSVASVPSVAGRPLVIEILVPATYEYETRALGVDGGQGQIAGRGETSYPFRLAKTGGEWRIVSSELFEQFATRSMEQFLGWIFLVVFLAVVAVFFWGWMTLDAYVHTGRTGYSLAVLLTPPVGALVYFFAVYLRGKSVRREEG